jgi:hypothetical protein
LSLFFSRQFGKSIFHVAFLVRCILARLFRPPSTCEPSTATAVADGSMSHGKARLRLILPITNVPTICLFAHDSTYLVPSSPGKHHSYFLDATPSAAQRGRGRPRCEGLAGLPTAAGPFSLTPTSTNFHAAQAMHATDRLRG